MVVFEGSGGMIELLRRGDEEGLGDLGVVVPYLDVEAMADAVLGLLDDPARRTTIGQRVGSVVQRDHDVDVAAPQLLEVVERVIGRSLR
jgi:glycosyltransferase involved in cell wall biosynthesis